jgi:hypothetical protein
VFDALGIAHLIIVVALFAVLYGGGIFLAVGLVMWSIRFWMSQMLQPRWKTDSDGDPPSTTIKEEEEL